MSQTISQVKPLAAPFTATGLAPCKINLTLDVFAPRPDGFHDLASLVVPMAYPADTITVSADFLTNADAPTEIILTCDNPALPTDGKNFAFRAARDFADVFMPPTGVQIRVDLIKRLPYQAGLGGGSSDAATVLRLLMRHHVTSKPPVNIMDTLSGRGIILDKIASRIGSDVPLFLSGGTVLMRGRGEKVEPIRYSSLPPLFGVIVKPTVGVPTGPAYALLDAIPNRSGQKQISSNRATTALYISLLREQARTVDDLGPLLSNDFEAAVLPAYPEVNEAYQAVQEAGAVRALLCGSGSAIFGLAHDRAHARHLVSVLQNRFPWVAETSTLVEDDEAEAEAEAEPNPNG